MSAFTDYLNSFAWASNRIDRSIFTQSGQGRTAGQIGEMNNLTANAIRQRVYSLTKNICKTYFDNIPFNKEILLLTEEELKTFTARLEFGKLDFNYYSEFGDDLILKINAKTQAVTDYSTKNFSDDDVVEVIMALARFSERSAKDYFNHLNTDALNYVCEQMKLGEYNQVLKVYKVLVDKITGYRKLTDKQKEQLISILNSEGDE
jgi:hypothetical protein